MSQTLPGTSGNETITGGTSADLLNATGAGGNDSIIGSQGADTIFADGGDTVDAGPNNDQIILSGGNNSINGGANEPGGDLLTFNFNGDITISGSTVSYVIDGTLFNSTVTATENLLVQVGAGQQTVAFANGVYAVCFAEGTKITTSLGEVAVEDLRGGDLVATVSGEGAPMKPVLWVGRRRVQLAGNPAAEQLAPVRVKAGALGHGVPHRDLLVSPDHCLFLDGALVPARLLVNGRSIVTEREFAAITYYHVELETHDVLLAEGAAAESWLDTGNRAWFENSALVHLAVTETLDAYGTGWDATRACAPLLHGGEGLAAIRARLDARAEELAAPAARAA